MLSYKTPKKKIGKTVFFFSLSASDSLNLSPFCHPVDTLLDNGLHVISTTLPDHENNNRPYPISDIWGGKTNTIEQFLNDLQTSILEISSIFPPPYGAMGISRGGFIALHLASMMKEISSVCCFSPMLSVKEKLSIFPIKKHLTTKKIHFFVGHNDTLINTKDVINLSHEITSLAQEKKQHNVNIQTTIFPSIGRHGHGTPDPIFQQGAQWITNNL